MKMTQQIGTRRLGVLMVLAGAGVVIHAQTPVFPNYRVVLDGTAKPSHYRTFFDYNPDFHNWLGQQTAAGAASQMGITAAQVAGVDQVCGQVAAQLQQLAANRARDLVTNASQSDAVLRNYEFLRVRTALEGALKLAQSLDEASWNKLRSYIIGPFQNQPKTNPISWR